MSSASSSGPMVRRKKSSSHVPSVLRSPQETAAFAKDPAGYLKSKLAKGGEVFGGRVLHWPVLFAGSHAAVQQVFDDQQTFRHTNAYSTFTGMSLYGQQVLQMEEKDAEIERHRLRMCKLFGADDSEQVGLIFGEQIRHITSAFMRLLLQEAKAKGQVQLKPYTTFKDVCVDIFSHVFLLKCLVDEPVLGKHLVKDAELFEAASSKLWQGVQSSGLKFGGVLKSAFGDGERAAASMARMFTASRSRSGHCPFDPHTKNNNNNNNSQTDKPDAPAVAALSEEEAARYFILSTSSMVTKATSSLVTSFMLHIQAPANKAVLQSLRDSRIQTPGSCLYLRKVLREIERLLPPVIGCCRTTNTERTSATTPLSSSEPKPFDHIDFSKGAKVWCSFVTANLDPKVFESPDELRPSRWDCQCVDGECSLKQQPCKKAPSIFTYGGGERVCPGQAFARAIVEQICVELLDAFVWRLDSSGSRSKVDPDKVPEYRWLPVGRPKNHVTLRMWLLAPSVTETTNAATVADEKDDAQTDAIAMCSSPPPAADADTTVSAADVAAGNATADDDAAADDDDATTVAVDIVADDVAITADVATE